MTNEELYNVIDEKGIGSRGEPIEYSDPIIKRIRKKINSSKYVAVLAAYLHFVGTPAVLTDLSVPFFLGEKNPSTKEWISYKPENFKGSFVRTIFLAATPVRESVNFARNKLENCLNERGLK